MCDEILPVNLWPEVTKECDRIIFLVIVIYLIQSVSNVNALILECDKLHQITIIDVFFTSH